MAKLRNFKLFFILFEIVLGISASTHWIVTENGRIQSHVSVQVRFLEAFCCVLIKFRLLYSYIFIINFKLCYVVIDVIVGDKTSVFICLCVCKFVVFTIKEGNIF